MSMSAKVHFFFNFFCRLFLPGDPALLDVYPPGGTIVLVQRIKLNRK